LVKKEINSKKITMEKLLQKLLDYTIEKFGEKGEISEVSKHSGRLIKYGLCGVAQEMEFDELFTEEEADSIYKYINDNMPIHREDWGWGRGLLSHRIRWLLKQIKKESNK
jgi:hypothetical protein